MYLVSTARRWGVGDLRFNPAVFLDVVEIEVIVEVCLQRRGQQFQKKMSLQNRTHGINCDTLWEFKSFFLISQRNDEILQAVVLQTPKLRKFLNQRTASERQFLCTLFPLKNSPPNKMISSFSGCAQSDAFSLENGEATGTNSFHWPGSLQNRDVCVCDVHSHLLLTSPLQLLVRDKKKKEKEKTGY